jgi:hypothetical protein
VQNLAPSGQSDGGTKVLWTYFAKCAQHVTSTDLLRMIIFICMSSVPQIVRIWSMPIFRAVDDVETNVVRI